MANPHFDTPAYRKETMDGVSAPFLHRLVTEDDTNTNFILDWPSLADRFHRDSFSNLVVRAYADASAADEVATLWIYEFPPPNPDDSSRPRGAGTLLGRVTLEFGKALTTEDDNVPVADAGEADDDWYMATAATAHYVKSQNLVQVLDGDDTVDAEAESAILFARLIGSSYFVAVTDLGSNVTKLAIEVTRQS